MRTELTKGVVPAYKIEYHAGVFKASLWFKGNLCPVCKRWKTVDIHQIRQLSSKRSQGTKWTLLKGKFFTGTSRAKLSFFFFLLEKNQVALTASVHKLKWNSTPG